MQYRHRTWRYRKQHQYLKNTEMIHAHKQIINTESIQNNDTIRHLKRINMYDILTGKAKGSRHTHEAKERGRGGAHLDGVSRIFSHIE